MGLEIVIVSRKWGRIWDITFQTCHPKVNNEENAINPVSIFCLHKLKWRDEKFWKSSVNYTEYFSYTHIHITKKMVADP